MNSVHVVLSWAIIGCAFDKVFVEFSDCDDTIYILNREMRQVQTVPCYKAVSYSIVVGPGRFTRNIMRLSGSNALLLQNICTAFFTSAIVNVVTV